MKTGMASVMSTGRLRTGGCSEEGQGSRLKMGRLLSMGVAAMARRLERAAMKEKPYALRKRQSLAGMTAGVIGRGEERY